MATATIITAQQHHAASCNRLHSDAQAIIDLMLRLDDAIDRAYFGDSMPTGNYRAAVASLWRAVAALRQSQTFLDAFVNGHEAVPHPVEPVTDADRAVAEDSRA